VAGTYQFASGKSRYLGRSRASTALIRRHWTEASPRRSATRIGIAHGLACVGCSWALMLVTVSRGGCPLLWMEALTALMVAEKTTPLGHRARKATGGILLTAALVVALTT
jgi:predicted metal-binding membrane protein